MRRHKHILQLWHLVHFFPLTFRAMSAPTGSSCPDQPVTILLCYHPCNPFPKLSGLAACCQPWPCLATLISGLGGGPAPSTRTCGAMAGLLAEHPAATGQLGSSCVGTGHGPSMPTSK